MAADYRRTAGSLLKRNRYALPPKPLEGDLQGLKPPSQAGTAVGAGVGVGQAVVAHHMPVAHDE